MTEARQGGRLTLSGPLVPMLTSVLTGADFVSGCRF